MEQLTISDIPAWFLSGKTTVQLQGRDFSQSVDEYTRWVAVLGLTTGLHTETLVIADPPGVVVRTTLSSDKFNSAEPLRDPMIRVSRKTCGWLFCVESYCRNRVAVPGSVCGGVHK